MGARGPTNVELLRQLVEAGAAIDAGQLGAARTVAAGALRQAQASGDVDAMAQAQRMLALHDAETGRFRRAAQAAQRAAQLFQSQADISGEALALITLAHAASSCGRHEDAVEAALLATRLGSLLPPGTLQVQAAHGLGMAYLWARCHEGAESALNEAERLCAAAGMPPLLPRVGLLWLELMRLTKARYYDGTLPSFAALRQRLDACAGLLDSPRPIDGQPGLRNQTMRLALCARALLDCWTGDGDQARRRLAAARASAGGQPLGKLEPIFKHWVQAELEWSGRNLHAARRSATLMIECAGRAEFEQMAFVGHMLRGHVLRGQGRLDLALEEEQLHRRREQRVQADVLDNRLRAVQAQLEVRSNLNHLRMLALRSQELERLSYEDALTAIANRRCFETRLNALLCDGFDPDQPLCLALIDLNDFKAINDTYSHSTGDEVLKSVAQAIRSAVREADLPARFGGDEFVVLFPHTTLEVARQVCERIHSMVAQLRWDQLAPALRVSASIGVAQAQAADTPASLLRRADTGMFSAKGRAQRLAA